MTNEHIEELTLNVIFDDFFTLSRISLINKIIGYMTIWNHKSNKLDMNKTFITHSPIMKNTLHYSNSFLLHKTSR